MNNRNPKIDWFFVKAGKWQEEFENLREIILETGLKEELKWGQACYTQEKKNIVLIHGFKEYCAILFFKGALLKDPKKILIQQTENTQSTRQVRFTSTAEVRRKKPAIKALVKQAMEVEKAGLRVTLKKTSEYEMPEEFRKKLDSNPSLKKAFYRLTPGRQRGYLFYFSQAKQSATRAARVEKCIPAIMDGKGLND